MNFRAAVTIAFLAHVATLTAHQFSLRDSGFLPTTGTATISGVVISDEDPVRPVRRAVVALTGADLRPSRGVVTDDEGRFSIRELPAGRFTLTVSRASYITSVYGAKRPGRPGTPLVVVNGAKIDGLRVRVWRGAVVAGVVRDATGTPMPGVPVHAIPAKAAGKGSLASLTNSGVRTNEAGEYRIFGLEPGAYVVKAEPAAGLSQIVALRETEVDVMLEALKRRTGTPSAPQPTMPSTAPLDFAPVYYPGVVSLAQATPLNLAAGREIEGLDIVLQPVQRSVVTGKVVRPDGTPAAGAIIQLTLDVPPGPFSTGAPSPLSTTAGRDGAFRLAQVASGNYTLIARTAAGGLLPQARSGVLMAESIGPHFWAHGNLTVSGGDVDGVTLVLEAGLTIAGRVVFRGDAVKLPPSPMLRVSVWPASVVTQKAGTPIATIAFVPGASVGPDGTFEIRNLPPCVCRVLVSGETVAGGEWFPQSAVIEGRELLDGDFEIRAGGRAEMTVTLSNRTTELSGRLQSPSRAPVSDVFVIAYSANRAFWGPGARRVQAVRPGVDGRYSIRNLPAGEYLLAAVLDIDQDDWNDRTFLEQLVPASIKITIGDGEKKVQDLRIGG